MATSALAALGAPRLAIAPGRAPAPRRVAPPARADRARVGAPRRAPSAIGPSVRAAPRGGVLGSDLVRVRAARRRLPGAGTTTARAAGDPPRTPARAEGPAARATTTTTPPPTTTTTTTTTPTRVVDACDSRLLSPRDSSSRRRAPRAPAFAGSLALLGLGGAGLFGSGFALDGPASTAEAIAVLASIIFVHECGHFFAARSQNIHVSKFSVGFGPSLLSYKGPEVEYSLRLIPLGGFVAFPDDDPDCPYPEDDPDLLRNRPAGDRALVVSAGVAANVAFALAILLTQVNTVGFAEQRYTGGVRVSQLLSTSAARDCGVEAGDVIVAVDGDALEASGRSVNEVVDRVRRSAGAPMRFDVERRGEARTIEVKPSLSPGGEGRIGVQLEANAEVVKRVAKDPAEGVALAAREFARLTGLVAKSLFSLVSDFDAAKQNVSGPIAIVGVGAEVMRTSDLTGLYQFASVININLAVVNILPLPALDGGFLLLIALEAMRGGKKLPTEVEQSITASGVLLLLGSGMFLILRDTLNLFNGMGR